jgi:hypothetical protein
VLAKRIKQRTLETNSRLAKLQPAPSIAYPVAKRTNRRSHTLEFQVLRESGNERRKDELSGRLVLLASDRRGDCLFDASLTANVV